MQPWLAIYFFDMDIHVTINDTCQNKVSADQYHVFAISYVYRPHADQYHINFTHQWHFKKLPNIFSQHFCYASEVHTYNTRYASKSNFYKPRFRTNIGKQTTSAMATEMWQQLPTHVKNFSTHNFPKKLKEYLLAEQLTY